MRMLCVFLTIGVSATASAQSFAPEAGGFTGSLGQPPTLKWTAAAAVGREVDGHAAAAFGLQRDLVSPVISLLAVHGEVYLRSGGADLTPGVRARLLSPFARVGMGADYRPGGVGPDLFVSVFHPIRRGGLFADGSVLRVDYLPARNHGFAVGIERPVLRQRPAGRGRPAHDHVSLPTRARPLPRRPLAPGIAAHVAALADAADRIRLTTLPLGPLPARRADDAAFLSGRVAALRSARPTALHDSQNGPDAGGSAVADVRRYHRALDAGFAAAGHVASDPAAEPGTASADAARRILLEHVLLPYNRLLGQTKRPDALTGLSTTAYGEFERWLHLESAIPPDRRQPVLQLFDALLDIIEDNRAALFREWRDSRFVWLPLQYGLRPEQHDTQQELDAIIEQAVGLRFTEGNFVSYLVNEQFQHHLSSSIREASDYHVLWTHDFRGTDDAGDPDEMAYRHVLSSYLPTLTERVRAYDRTGRIPTYMIVMDQFFYEVNGARLWMTLLEDPLGHQIRLPRSHSAWQEALAAAQQELRDAVAASSLLQSQAALYGDAWLKNLIKVHVSITNPADPSFWSRSVIRGVPLPDEMMRDHRKIVFYDLSEDDPYRGGAIFTGAGVGEHYASLSWEDRSLLVRGPALLPLKSALRELLLSQGVRAERLPQPLLPRPLAADYDERVRAAGVRNLEPLRALQLHNGAGFAAKDVNVAKAVLYTLMPPGSVLKIPDSLWNSDFWGSLLLGAALRGGRVLIIAPAERNAPADKLGTLGRSRELLSRLVSAERMLEHDIAAAGGLLRVGIFSTELAVTDIPAKGRRALQALNDQPWLRSLFGFPQSVLDDVAELTVDFAELTMAPVPMDEFEHDGRSKLHLKANFFASAEAWTLMQRPEWANATWAFMLTRVGQVQARSAAVLSFAETPEPVPPVGGGMVLDWQAGLDADSRERVIFYTLMGSHNQNSRSIVIDAEVGFLISQWPAIIPYIDLITIIGQTRWLDHPDELAPLLPFNDGWRARLAHWIRLAL
jgi:hypothetical protein